MQILDERFTEKAYQRKQLRLKTILHQSTIDKITDEEGKEFIELITGKNF